VFRYPLMARHPAPLNALRAEIRRLRDGGSTWIGVIGFSAGGHLAGLAALADDADADEAVDFAVLGYAITSMETETYRPSRLILLGEDGGTEAGDFTGRIGDAFLATVLSLAHSRRRVRAARAHIPASCLARRPRCSTCRPCLRPRPPWSRLGKRGG